MISRPCSAGSFHHGGGTTLPSMMPSPAGGELGPGSCFPLSLTRGTIRLVPPSNDPSPRELEILVLVADGLTGPEIAERLGTSRGTVHTQQEAIRRRLGARSMAHALALAYVRGYIAPAPQVTP